MSNRLLYLTVVLKQKAFLQTLVCVQWHMFIETPGEGISTCRSKRSNGELIEKTRDYVVVS